MTPEGCQPRFHPPSSSSSALASCRSRVSKHQDHALAVVGFGHRFENSFALQAEHFYNGAGDSDDLILALLRLQTGAALNQGRETTGLLISYEITPILLGQVTTLYSCSAAVTQISSLPERKPYF